MTAIQKPTRYRRIPTETYAMQFDGDNFDSITAWVGPQRLKRIPSGTVCLWVDANKGWLAIEKGEWILQDKAGFYPCKDKVFGGTYSRISITPAIPEQAIVISVDPATSVSDVVAAIQAGSIHAAPMLAAW